MQVEAHIEQELDPTQGETAGSRIARVSVADALYLIVIGAAAVMRFSQLGSIPLSTAEAREALAAWQVLQPGSPLLEIGSPAYFTLTSLLMPLLGDSDTAARLVPAIFGLGLVCLPWLLRRQIGAYGALMAAAFLAVSPLNSAISRTAGGDAIALFAVLLVAVSTMRMTQDSDSKWFVVSAAAMGLGLASSPLFYGGLATLAAALLLVKVTGTQSLTLTLPDRGTVINGTIAGLVVMVGLSTRIFTYPAGLGASAQIAGNWLGQFGYSGSIESVLAPLFVLARYEIALVVLGFASIIWALWRDNAPAIQHSMWLVMALTLIVLQSGTLSNVLLATLPGYLLIGLASASLFRRPFNQWTGLFTGGLLLIGAVLLVNTTRYLRVSVFEQDLSNVWMGLLAVAGAVLLVYYFWALTEASITQGLWLASIIFLLAYEWGTAWQLTHTSANDPRESWVTEGTDDDLPLMLKNLRDISRQATNSDSDLRLLSAVDTPVLRWYLRDFWQGTIGESVPPDAQEQVIISRVEDGEPAFGSDYVGSDFGLQRIGTEPAPESATPWSDLLRWWLFHETAVKPIEQRVILWVRSDLVMP
jgi:hypothetical protein